MPRPAPPAGGWDCHTHVFDRATPVRPGHYQPAHHPLREIEGLAARHGVAQLVLVQPSVYGNDNAVMLRALEAGQGRHRGVAVIDPAIGDSELERLHAAGVRGVRFNLVSPASPPGDALADLQALAPRLRALGWHVQWYVPPAALPSLVRWQVKTGLCFVLDHLAGLSAQLMPEDPAWAAAQALADAGAWIKLSGWYRLGANEPYATLRPNIERVTAMFGRRMVWGSDWPHTSFLPGHLPSYESTLFPVRSALGEAVLHDVLHLHACSLYFDNHAISP